MESPRERIREVRQTLPDGVELVAVSKYHPAEAIMDAYAGGQRCFGESHVQELLRKHDVLPSDIEWHFIGHLQTNKVKQIVPFVSLIHSVDSEHLLREIDKQAMRCGRVMPVLLQVHVAQEETKFGWLPEELLSFVQGDAWRQYEHVSLAGLMCMATNTDDEARIASDFERASQLFDCIKAHIATDTFRIRSWGMSGDYLIALRHGSTMVRIGSAIFGERIYA